MHTRRIGTLLARCLAIALLALAVAPLGGVGAQNAPSLSIVSPTAGAAITSTDIAVQVKISNFTVDCAQLGRPDQAGVGQILALVDGTTIAQLTNFYCSDTFTIPGDGLAPGEHTIAVVLASNTHAPMMDTAQVVKINYQPALAVPLPAANNSGAPAVTLVSPLDGATVPPVFDVQVRPSNLTVSTGLEGKANVAGYGHYHVWVDAAEMPKSLANLVLMPGTNGFTLNLTAWGEGQHTIRVEAAQDDHSMYAPATAATFKVTVSKSATPTAAAPSAASTPASPAASASNGATLDLVDIAFQPTELTIPANQNVTLTLTNQGASQHNFSITDNNNPTVKNLNISVNVAPGQTQTVTINAPAGDYYFFCNVPGHEAAGMHGALHVK